ATGNQPFTVVVADMDGDGKLDLITPNANNTISVLRNTSTEGHLSMSGAAQIPMNSAPRNVAVRDLDGDGRPDLVSANYYAQTISLVRSHASPGNLSAASFSPPIDLPLDG